MLKGPSAALLGAPSAPGADGKHPSVFKTSSALQLWAQVQSPEGSA